MFLPISRFLVIIVMPKDVPTCLTVFIRAEAFAIACFGNPLNPMVWTGASKKCISIYFLFLCIKKRVGIVIYIRYHFLIKYQKLEY